MSLIPGSGDLLEEAMATHFGIPAWKIPWTETGSPWGRKESDTPE